MRRGGNETGEEQKQTISLTEHNTVVFPIMAKPLLITLDNHIQNVNIRHHEPGSLLRTPPDLDILYIYIFPSIQKSNSCRKGLKTSDSPATKMEDDSRIASLMLLINLAPDYERSAWFLF